MKTLLWFVLAALAADPLAAQDLLGFSRYKFVKDRSVEVSVSLFGVSILPGQNQKILVGQLPRIGQDENNRKIVLEGPGERVILRYSDKGIYETSFQSTGLGYTKEVSDFEDQDLTVTLFGVPASHVTLSRVLEQWGLPDFYQNIGEVMYTMQPANEIVILGYNIYGVIDRVSITNGEFTGDALPF